MNRIVWIIIIFFTLNGFCSLFGFLFPNLPMDKVLPIQLWFNAILIFMLFLSQNVASFLPEI
jgi:hypothetical protein